MACYHPVPAYQPEKHGKVQLNPPRGDNGREVSHFAVRCGKCLGCRTDHATRWANRCTHEASLSRHSIFLTLTYADENLPNDAHLRPRDLQLFLKRLRKRAAGAKSDIQTDRSRTLRFFACGEYGEETWRPHYHLLVFNCRPKTAERVGKDSWASDAIHDLWPAGSHQWGDFTPRGANYIAKYTLKQLTHKYVWGGNDADENGEWIPRRGIIDPAGNWRPAPFLRMSKGIGKDWLAQYHSDLQRGYLIQDGNKVPIPRYYKQKLQEVNKQTLATLEYYQDLNQQRGDKNEPARLKDAERIHLRKRQLTEKRGF